MNTIIISAPTKKDIELLKQLANKMGYKAQVTSTDPGHSAKKKKGIQDKTKVADCRPDEITLMSEPSLAEAWLSPEDDAYNDL